MIKRTVLTRTAASVFYRASTENETKYSDVGHNHFEGIGGYWRDIDGVWIAFDWTNGEEVFIEEFISEEEAKKYASGVMATTKGGYKI